jgi:type 1 glutamine amidotransferase
MCRARPNIIISSTAEAGRLMNVLVLCDDHWHPARTSRTGLSPLTKAGFTFDFVEDVSAWSPAWLDAYPVVLLTKSNNVSSTDDMPWVTPAVEAAVAAHVCRGGGLLVVHSGTVGYGNTQTLRPLIGGVFDHHPKQCPVTVTPQPGHALTAGVMGFTEKDEHYFMQFDGDDAAVFLCSTSEHGTQPAGWTRQEGQGRVCVLTPGHNVEVWLLTDFQTLLRNALIWCAPTQAA